MLFRRQQKEAIDAERSRMHAGMYNACEELRKTKGPAGRGEGYLYRVAMEKKGVWRMGAIPIEYGRMQTDTPPKEAWDHNWKR
jgi:large subunit ribosomal protein L40